MRGLWAAATAPVFATTVIGVGSTIAGWIGVGWSILPALATALVIAAGIVIVRRVTRTHSTVRFPARWRWWTVGVFAVTALAIALLVVRVLQSPDAISQSFDNIFHLNAIRYIVDTGIASPLEIGQMTSPSGGLPFYPSAWHATVALVVQVSGSGIPLAINAMSLTTAAVTWPLGILVLSRVLLGSSPSVMVGTGIVAAAVPAFPLLPMDFGVLYPYQLALALLPVALAATAGLLGIGRSAGRLAPGWWALVVVGSLPGLALAHPGGFVGWLALTVPMVIVFGVRLWRTSARASHRVWIAVGAVGYGIVGVLLLRALRPPLATRQWPTETGLGDAAWRVLSVTLFYPAGAWLVGIAVLVGLYWVVREREAELIVAASFWLVGAVLFITAIALPWGTLRDALTGSWYNNWPRLAALLALALVPLAALGIARTADAAARLLRRRGVSGAVRLSAAIVSAMVVFLAFHMQATPRAQGWASDVYGYQTGTYLLTADEFALLERLDEEVPADAVIAGSAFTGAGLAYAIADRHVLMPHALMDISDDLELVNEHLSDALTMPEVCEAIDALDVDYVLDFGTQEVHGDDLNPLPGIENLQDSPAVRLIDSEGDARLYLVTACGRG
ncbi:hypothetical protein QFZ46_003206 [Microbacterium murale]|uniref:Uncharacterized protein n=2 Tax=Microbacterium murale TaxID=1081040 RepID=A0ABU0PCH9_9MICO|nr:hypothetical protein [Microbacterium murale]